jgi:hypothetical protein
MSLQQQIDDKKKEISTDGYPMSIGELMSLYKDGELDIHPEFQRFFRWTSIQKSKLIESIMLGIPIPSIFVSQREDGVWDVVDGLQRLSTIFEFAGILKDEANDLLPPSVLLATQYLPALEGKMWENQLNPVDSFDASQKLSFKREKIDVKIVKKESDREIKFELFQRLNTLGSKLSDQEVRNCLLVMIDKSFYDWLKNLSIDPHFLNSTALGERLIDEQYNMELALRFVVLNYIKSDEVKGLNDFSEFITDKMIAIAKDGSFDREAMGNTFVNTFRLIDETVSDDAFKKFNQTKSRFEGRFLIAAFETVAIGLGKNINTWRDVNEAIAKTSMNTKIREVWNDPTFIERNGSGVNVTSRVPHNVPVGERIFKYEEDTNTNAVS